MIPSFVGLHGRLEGIIARLLGAVRGTQPQMKMTGAAEFVICDYAIIVTLCGSSRKSPLTILRGRISMPRQESAPHKVTMNHIINRDRETSGKSGGY
jgi:hypothetical protein